VPEKTCGCYEYKGLIEQGKWKVSVRDEEKAASGIRHIQRNYHI
jgi:hypothetical protein